MAHNIAEINGKSAMAYQGETPWHLLGQKSEFITSVQDFMAEAQLNWNVELLPMFYPRSINGLEPRPEQVPNRKAVVRSSDGVCLGTVGDSYQPLQNSEAFEVLQPAIDEFGVEIETAGALGKGERVWMLAKLPNTFEPVAGDAVGGYFLITTGHDGATPYVAKPTPIRVVCQNTLNMTQKDKAIVRLSHTRTGKAQLDMVAELIANLVASLEATNQSFASLAAKRMDKDEVVAFIRKTLGIPEEASLEKGVMARRVDAMVNLAFHGTGIDTDGQTTNAWNVYNSVTEYVDHQRLAEAKNVKAIMRAAESAVFGTNDLLKARALDLALTI